MEPIQSRNKKNDRFQDEKKHASNCSNLNQCKNVANEIRRELFKMNALPPVLPFKIRQLQKKKKKLVNPGAHKFELLVKNKYY